MTTTTEKEGSTLADVNGVKTNTCHGCTHLRYDHDWIYDCSNGYYCGKNWKGLEEVGDHIITPENCPVKKIK